MDDPKDQQFARQVAKKAERKERARRVERQQIWSWLGLFGIVGWSVALPTLIGVAAGAWLDARYHGRISWTLTLLLVGAMLGSLAAWHWTRRESRNGEHR